jgi:adenosylhomocysteinase
MMTTLTIPPNDVKDLGLADQGRQQLLWAERDMPVLGMIQERFAKNQPFKGLRVSMCAHLTKETGNMVRAVKAGGADLVVVASNPLTTQDDVVASLVAHDGISVYGYRGESLETYQAHQQKALDHRPQLLLDDGGDLVSATVSQKPDWAKDLIGSTEQTTAGITRLRALTEQRLLPWPAIGANESKTKHLYDNRYGTGQSTLDSIMRACNILLCGKTVVIVGYGWCGKGCAARARGLGADVVVTEVDPLKALEALMEGYRVMPMAEAAKVGDLFITVTSNRHVIDAQHFDVMKHGAILCNAGHMNWEFHYDALKAKAVKVNTPRPFVEVFTLPNGRELMALSEGRLVNLSAAEGHPASVMDMSFAAIATAAEHLMLHRGNLANGLMRLPDSVDIEIATLKLKSLGVSIDALTPEMEKYLHSWQSGTV